jgi:hypothetical protein
MKRKPLPTLATKLLSDLRDPLLSTTYTGLKDEIDDRIGPLSAPSKMPGWAWGISADLCLVGSVLAAQQGTPCSICYAQRNRYRMPNTRTAQQRRLDGYDDDPDWTVLMAIRIHLHGIPWFRWFDSGDLQHDRMYADIRSVCMLTPDIAHWLPTQERGIVKRGGTPPPNLVVRVSSTKIDDVQSSTKYNTSSVGSALSPDSGIHTCPSLHQKNKCGACRMCWDPAVPHVRYVRH